MQWTVGRKPQAGPGPTNCRATLGKSTCLRFLINRTEARGPGPKANSLLLHSQHDKQRGNTEGF